MVVVMFTYISFILAFLLRERRAPGLRNVKPIGNV